MVNGDVNDVNEP